MRNCRAKYVLWALISVFGLSLLLSACGQKGPLYLPDEKAAEKKKKKTG